MNIATAAIPVSPDVAARFAVLSTEQQRVVRMRVAVEIARLSKPASRAKAVAELAICRQRSSTMPAMDCLPGCRRFRLQFARH